MSDYVQKLPMELQLAILCYLPDLPCLYRLSCVSHSMNAVFESRPIEIFEAIISDLTGELKQVLRANAVALSSSLLNIAQLDAESHHDACEGSNSHYSLRLQDCVNPLPPTFPLPNLQQLILMSCRIEGLAISFFNTYLTRFNRIELEFLTRPELKPRPEVSQCDTSHCTRTGSSHPREISSVSWCEYYRVVCSLWRIQLRFSRCDLSKTGSRWSKMVAEADELVRITQMTDQREPWEQDTIACVREFIRKEEWILMNTSLDQLQRESDNFTIPTQSQFMLPLIASPLRDPCVQLEGSDRGAAQYASSAYTWFWDNSASVPRELFQDQDWKHFRRLGFGIWDRKRMMCMGLISRSVDHNDPERVAEDENIDLGREMTSKEQAFAWKSIRLDGQYALPRREKTKTCFRSAACQNR